MKNEQLERVRWALTRLSVHMAKSGDDRHYGINCARRIVDAIDSGSTIEEAVALIRVTPKEAS